MQSQLADTERLAVEALCRVAIDPVRVESMHGLVGDFCHLIRNRLNSLQIGLYLARGSDPTPDPAVWDPLSVSYRDAEKVVELFQTVCRPMALQTIRIGLDVLLADFLTRWEPRFAAVEVVVKPMKVVTSEPSRVDPTRFSQAFEALAAWRLRSAAPGATLRLEGHSERGRSRIEWHETGTSGGADGGALPLGVVARVASAHGGTFATEDRDGWRVVIEWPNTPSLPLT